jgi:hypothetical protein
MVGVIRSHRLDQADVVHDAADVREEIADQRAALPARLEAEQRTEDVLDALGVRPERRRLPVQVEQRGLVIERLEMREAAREEDEDHALRLRRVMRRLGRQRVRLRVIRHQLPEDAGEHQRAAHQGADRVTTSAAAVSRHR